METEQIVVDASRMSFDSACVTSFVQIRGHYISQYVGQDVGQDVGHCIDQYVRM